MIIIVERSVTHFYSFDVARITQAFHPTYSTVMHMFTHLVTEITFLYQRFVVFTVLLALVLINAQLWFHLLVRNALIP